MPIMRDLWLRTRAVRESVLIGREKAIARMLSEQDGYYKRVQDRIFDVEQTPPLPKNPERFVPIIRQPRYELKKFPEGRLIVLYYYPVSKRRIDIHLVFNDEVVPYSKRIDEYYRKFRLEKFGTTYDVESFIMILDEEGENVKRLKFPVSGNMLNGYTTSMHYYLSTSLFSKVDKRPIIYTKTFNHMLGVSPYLDPLISLTGGYEWVEPEKVVLASRKEVMVV